MEDLLGLTYEAYEPAVPEGYITGAPRRRRSARAPRAARRLRHPRLGPPRSDSSHPRPRTPAVSTEEVAVLKETMQSERDATASAQCEARALRDRLAATENVMKAVQAQAAEEVLSARKQATKRAHFEKSPRKSPRASPAGRTAAGRLLRGTKLAINGINKAPSRHSSRLALGRSCRQVMTKWVAGSAAALRGTEYLPLSTEGDDEGELAYGATGTPVKAKLVDGESLCWAGARSPAAAATPTA